MPGRKAIEMPCDTMEDCLRREKARYNSIIEKYICLAHGLPPPPDDSSFHSRTKTRSMRHMRKHQDNTNKIITPIPNQSKSPRARVIGIPSTSIKEEISLEIEESLQRRKKELGLPEDFVPQLQEWDNTSTKRKKGLTSQTSFRGRRKSLSGPKRQNKTHHKESVCSNISSTKRWGKKRGMNISGKDARKSCSENINGQERNSILQVSTKSRKLETFGQATSLRKRGSKEVKTYDDDDRLKQVSGESKKPKKGEQQISKQGAKNNCKRNMEKKIKLPNDVEKKRKKGLKSVAKSPLYIENKSIQGREFTRNIKGKLNMENNSSKKTRGKKRRDLGSNTEWTSHDRSNPPLKRRRTESTNTRQDQAAKVEPLKVNIGQTKAKRCSEQQGGEIQIQSLESNNNTPLNKKATRKGKEKAKTTQKKKATRKRKENAKTAQNKEATGVGKEQACKIPEEDIMKAVKGVLGSKARLIHVVQNGDDLFCLFDNFETIYLTCEKEIELNPQTAGKHKKTAYMTPGKKTTRDHANKDKSNATLDRESVKEHTIRETTVVPSHNQTVKKNMTKEKKMNVKPDQETAGITTHVKKTANTGKIQQLTLEMYAKRTTSTTNNNKQAEGEKSTRMEVNKEKKTITTQEELTSQLASEMSKNSLPAKQVKMSKGESCNLRKNFRTAQIKPQTCKQGIRSSDLPITVTNSKCSKTVAIQTPVQDATPVPSLQPHHKAHKATTATATATAATTTAATTITTATYLSAKSRVNSDMSEIGSSSMITFQGNHDISNNEGTRTSTLMHSTAQSSLLENGTTTKHTVNTIVSATSSKQTCKGTVVRNEISSDLSPALPCQLTKNNIRKRSFSLVSEEESEDDEDEYKSEDEWSYMSSESNTFEELNVKKKGRRKSAFPYQLPGTARKKKQQKQTKSSKKAAHYEDDDEPIILTSTRLPRPDNENNTNLINISNKKPMQPIGSYSPDKTTQGKEHLAERTSDHHKNLTGTSLSKTPLYHFALWRQRWRKGRMEALAERQAQGNLDENTYNLLQIPSLQQSSSYLGSRNGTSSQVSQLMQMSFVSHQVSASITGAKDVRRNALIDTAATTTATTSTNNTNSKASKHVRSFWDIESDEETENRKVMGEMVSIGISQSSQVTTKRSSSILPDYNTLGPERWMAAVKALNKNRRHPL